MTRDLERPVPMVGATETVKSTRKADLRAGYARAGILLVTCSGLLRIILAEALGPFTSSDSGRYTAGLDFTGIRGSPAPLVQVVWGLPGWVALVLQVGVSSLVWGLLALIVGRMSTRRLWSWTALALIVGFSWSPLVFTYDAATQTESLATSGVLSACVGVFVVAVPRVGETIGRPVGLMLCIGGTLLALSSRPPTIILVVPMLVVAVGLTWHEMVRRTRRMWLLILVSVVSIVAGWAVWAQSNSLIHSPQLGFVATSMLASRASPDYTALAQSKGMPSCALLPPELLDKQAQSAYSYIAFGPLVVRVSYGRLGPARQELSSRCPEVIDWLNSGSGPTPTEWLIHSPRDVFSQYLLDIPQQVFPVVWGTKSGTPITVAVASIHCLLNGLALVALLAAWTRTWKTRVDTPQTRGSHHLAAVMALSWVAYAFITWLGDPMELARHILPVTSLLAPLTLLACLAMHPETDPPTFTG